MIPGGLIHRGQLDSVIEDAIAKLGPDVAHAAYRVREDSTGDPSIFFRITLTDAAARRDILMDTTHRIRTTLFDELRPIENWGLHPYFNFRSQSERENRRDPDWE
jgi:hypothetical protein